MKNNIGETLILSVTVKDKDGELKDPATSMNIEISQIAPSVANIISSTAMTKDSIGKYHYDFASVSKPPGDYVAKYTATDGTRITIEKDKFQLE